MTTWMEPSGWPPWTCWTLFPCDAWWHWLSGCFSPVATRAVYTFTGFPDTPPRHLYLHHDGYPTGAAWRFAIALRDHPAATSFLSAFLNSQPGAEPLDAPEQVADAEYRYVVQWRPGDAPALQVQYWRRPPGSAGWIHRCGPMALAAFIQRFLPAGPGD